MQIQYGERSVTDCYNKWLVFQVWDRANKNFIEVEKQFVPHEGIHISILEFYKHVFTVNNNGDCFQNIFV